MGPAPSGPRTGAPAGPVARPAGPSTGGPPGLGLPARAATTPRGYVVEFDPTTWSVWWDFHMAEFLQARRALRQSRVVSGSDEFYLGGARRDVAADHLSPTRAMLEAEVVPALHRAMQTSASRDVITACLIALAKISIERAEQPLLPAFAAHLRSHDQEVRETAALAMGLSHRPEALAPLIELWLDTRIGRAMVNRARVDYRTRAFAGYGIGLIAHATSDVSVARLALWALETPLRGSDTSERDVLVAAIQGLRLVRGSADDHKARALSGEIAGVLWPFYQRRFGSGESILQAHVAPAIGAVLGPGGDTKGDYLHAFSRDLDDAAGTSGFVRQSAAIALGELRVPAATDAGEADALWRYIRLGKDQQARYFAVIAAARIGGDQHRSALLLRLRSATTIERPWVALALGLLARSRLAAGAPTDATIGRALHELLVSEKNEDVLAASAIAVGLSRWQDASADLCALLARSRQRDDLAGHLCVAAAMLGDTSVKDLLREVVATSTRRPTLLVRAATALGALGDHAVVADLTQVLAKPAQSVTILGAVGRALGAIGDRRSIPPLLALLREPSLPELSRAFAAAALGGIGDKEDVPWNAKIARVINYRANVETLTDQMSGILDIL